MGYTWDFAHKIHPTFSLNYSKYQLTSQSVASCLRWRLFKKIDVTVWAFVFQKKRTICQTETYVYEYQLVSAFLNHWLRHNQTWMLSRLYLSLPLCINFWRWSSELLVCKMFTICGFGVVMYWRKSSRPAYNRMMELSKSLYLLEATLFVFYLTPKSSFAFCVSHSCA